MDTFRTYHGEKFWVVRNKTKDGFLVYHLRPEENMILIGKALTIELAEAEASKFAETFTAKR